jgi:hypothetical protein
MERQIRPILSAALLLLLNAGLATAQTSTGQGTPKTNDPSLAPSLTVGYLNTDFSYRGTSATAYDFEGPLAALMLGWQQGSLTLSYGTSDSTSVWPALRTANASLWIGGDVYIFRSLFRLPLALYVPLRLNADYGYVSLNTENASADGPDDRPTLHLAGGGLGAGGGARLAFPVGPSFIKDNLVAQVSYVFAPGLMGNLGEGFDAARTLERPLDELKLRWATDLNVELQFKNLLGDSVGVMAGYTLRTVSRSPEKPSAFGDVLDTFVDRSDFVEVTDQHVFRIGINW